MRPRNSHPLCTVQLGLVRKHVFLLAAEPERAVEVVVALPSLRQAFDLGRSRSEARPNASKNFLVVTWAKGVPGSGRGWRRRSGHGA